jgi:hypothetical protein
MTAAKVDHISPCQRAPARRENARKKDVRINNIQAAKAVADAVRTSLGPRGMDKMVGSPSSSGRASPTNSNTSYARQEARHSLCGSS